jgi:hypothetical protein
MAWTYIPAQLATSSLFQVRFLIGDTDESDPLLTDEEINFLLAELGSASSTAIASCENLSAKYARQVDTHLGPSTVKASQRTKQFTELAARLTKQFGKLAVPTMSSDQKNPVFDKDMMNAEANDYPLAEEES